MLCTNYIVRFRKFGVDPNISSAQSDGAGYGTFEHPVPSGYYAICTKNFAIKVDRKGSHEYDSTELARNVAGAVFDKWPNISVDLDSPELEICVQIINNKCIIYLKYS